MCTKKLSALGGRPTPSYVGDQTIALTEKERSLGYKCWSWLVEYQRRNSEIFQLMQFQKFQKLKRENNPTFLQYKLDIRKFQGLDAQLNIERDIDQQGCLETWQEFHHYVYASDQPMLERKIQNLQRKLTKKYEEATKLKLVEAEIDLRDLQRRLRWINEQYPLIEEELRSAEAEPQQEIMHEAITDTKPVVTNLKPIPPSTNSAQTISMPPPPRPLLKVRPQVGLDINITTAAAETRSDLHSQPLASNSGSSLNLEISYFPDQVLKPSSERLAQQPQILEPDATAALHTAEAPHSPSLSPKITARSPNHNRSSAPSPITPTTKRSPKIEKSYRRSPSPTAEALHKLNSPASKKPSDRRKLGRKATNNVSPPRRSSRLQTPRRSARIRERRERQC